MGEVPLNWAFDCLAAIEYWKIEKQDEKYGKEYLQACGQACDFCECPVPKWIVDVWKRRREVERVCREAKRILGRSDAVEAGLLAQLVSLVCPPE